MKIKTFLSRTMVLGLCALGLLVAGCKTSHEDAPCCTMPMEGTNAAVKILLPATPVISATPTPVAVDANELPPVRIKAGPSPQFKDAEGNVWFTDRGFVDGETVERPEVVVTNTTTPAIYQSERYSMSAFSYPVPNGKYVVKLHFAECYEDLDGPGQRVFSFNVEGKEFKDFDVWVKAGGPRKAYVETVPVEVTDGKLDITFTEKEQNPMINGIEILPAN